MPGLALSLVVLKTRQVDRLRTFYGSLGVELVEELHGNGPVHYAGRIGDVVFEVYPASEVVTAGDGAVRLGFTLDNLIEAVDAMKTRAYPVVTEPQATKWGVRAVLRDPDGRAVELYQRRTP